MATPSVPRLAHDGVTCNSCAQVIVGARFKCMCCPNVDSCETCVSLLPLRPEEVDEGACRHEMLVRVVDPKLGQTAAVMQNQEEWAREGVACALCATPVRGRLFTCTVCDDTAFCEKCDLSGKHDPAHAVLRHILQPAPAVLAPEPAPTFEAAAHDGGELFSLYS